MTRPKASLTDVEGETSKPRTEVTRLQKLLIKVEEKASLAERHTSKVAVEVIEAFQKGEVFHKELLKPFLDAYSKGV